MQRIGGKRDGLGESGRGEGEKLKNEISRRIYQNPIGSGTTRYGRGCCKMTDGVFRSGLLITYSKEYLNT